MKAMNRVPGLPIRSKSALWASRATSYLLAAICAISIGESISMTWRGQMNLDWFSPRGDSVVLLFAAFFPIVTYLIYFLHAGKTAPQCRRAKILCLFLALPTLLYFLRNLYVRLPCGYRDLEAIV